MHIDDELALEYHLFPSHPSVTLIHSKFITQLRAREGMKCMIMYMVKIKTIV